MTDSKVTVLHTDVGCRELLQLWTIVAISGLEETLDAEGIQELEVHIVESDGNRFLSNP